LTLFLKLKDAAVAELEYDEFAGLDPDAQAKAIAKRDAADKKKLERLEEAKKRAEEIKMKRQQSRAVKEEEKAKKKGTKRKAETPAQELATNIADTMRTSSGFSLTVDRVVHGLTPSTDNRLAARDIDECIMNLSLEALPKNKKAFNDVLSFLDMVIFISYTNCHSRQEYAICSS